MAFWETVMTSSRDKRLPYGKRLVPVLLDQYAKEEPNRVCFSIPRSADIAEGFQDVTFGTFANAVNKIAHFIHREIGRSSVFETVLYMGYQDLRYFIALVALMKTGHKALFSAHQNSVAGHADLIKRTDCSVLIHSAGFPVGGILEKCRLETICIPELENLLDDSIKCDHYPYNFTFEEAKSHPCLVVHTSGSTGFPKPVVWTQESLTLTDNQHTIPDLDGRPTIWAKLNDQVGRHFSALPVFHAAGIASGITRCLYNENIIVLPPPGLVTAETFEKVLDYGSIEDASCLPITLEEIAARPDILAKVHKLEKITYIGGSLSAQSGDTISQYVPLYNIMFRTETNTLVQHAPDRSDWQYICLNPVNGIEMRRASTSTSTSTSSVSTSTTHELAFIQDTTLSPFQGVFKVFPYLKEYRTSDLFSAHPSRSKSHHWKRESHPAQTQ